MPRAWFWGVPVDAILETDLHEHICHAIVQNLKVTFLHINVHGLNLAWQQPKCENVFGKPIWLSVTAKASNMQPDGWGHACQID